MNKEFMNKEFCKFLFEYNKLCDRMKFNLVLV